MYHVNGKKIKEIARELRVSKNTVKKVINNDTTKFELSKHKRKKPVIDQYLKEINSLLQVNSTDPKRRKLTARKVYEHLKKLGYVGSYETVNLVVRKFRRDYEGKSKQVFIPLKYESGDGFQFDWGE